MKIKKSILLFALFIGIIIYVFGGLVVETLSYQLHFFTEPFPITEGVMWYGTKSFGWGIIITLTIIIPIVFYREVNK
jgi:xanthine/uracil permease